MEACVLVRSLPTDTPALPPRSLKEGRGVEPRHFGGPSGASTGAAEPPAPAAHPPQGPALHGQSAEGEGVPEAARPVPALGALFLPAVARRRPAPQVTPAACQWSPLPLAAPTLKPPLPQTPPWGFPAPSASDDLAGRRSRPLPPPAPPPPSSLLPPPASRAARQGFLMSQREPGSLQPRRGICSGDAP